MADALLQPADNVGHRQHHLKVGILFGGQPAELLHRSLLVDLISFLPSDSLLRGVRVATFYELAGLLDATSSSGSSEVT
jgi:hypothetical protein